MFVFVCVAIFACSCLNDWFDRSVARELRRETGRSSIECLAVVKQTTVSRLRENRKVNAVCLVVAVVATFLLYGCQK